jgi:hypothetical protein
MKTRRLTKKYKNKSNRKSIKNIKNIKSIKRKNKNRINYKSKSKIKSKKRILSGGVHSVSSAKRSAPSIQSSIFKKPVKTQQEVFIDIFFTHLKRSEFPEALCALYKFYTQFPHSEIKSTLLSVNFKEQYQKTFYHLKQKVNPFGNPHCDAEARANYIYFLSYIFKKVAEGGFIFCDGKKLEFVYSIDKANPGILNILKKFLGYLDTACIATVSYTITAERYRQISSNEDNPTNDEKAVCEIISSLIILKDTFPSLEHILDNMTTHNPDGSIASYSINSTVISRFIKQSYTDFLEQMPQGIASEVGMVENH